MAGHERVLIIGGLGFIGSNLTARLAGEGARIRLLTPSRERHIDRAAAFERDGVSIVEGDVRNHELMTHLVQDQDVVFNLSGQSGAARSLDDPWTDLDVNCRGNLVLLESLREGNPAAKLIFVGSRLQYGRPGRLPATEDDAGDPTSLHAIHKATAEHYVRLYGRLYDLRFSAARVTNPFGPGQPGGRTAYGVINRFIHLALRDETIAIYGDGSQCRDYVHVDDVVSALVALARSRASDGMVYNVGSGEGRPMIEVARLIVEVVGGGRVEHVAWPVQARQIETGDFVADISRIRRDLGWAPTLSLREGLERTVAGLRRERA
jgi:nucleoside-diphosphate-sugar epimerase